jgi:hypothetical protein
MSPFIKDTSTLRVYAFTHFALRPIQQGIQSAHAVVELVTQEGLDEDEQSAIRRWTDIDKTLIVLNAGNSESLDSILFYAKRSGLPFAPFYEDEATLSNMLTAVAVLVPDELYNSRIDPDMSIVTASGVRLNVANHHLSNFITAMKNSHLAG